MTDSPKITLTYFDIAASRGEECRLALHVAGVPFHDNRIAFEQWAALKPNTPYGSLPTLEVEGKGTLAHSNAILTFIGRSHDLHPRDNWEAAKHEGLMCAVEDLRANVGPTMRIKDADEKKAAREALARDYLPTWGAKVEAQLGSGPFVAGDRLNVADIKLAVAIKWFRSGVLDHIPTDVFAACPKLNALVDAVGKHHRVADWYAKTAK
ncbi:glutathione S-transferase family protein [Nannocystaceae bacterium ST9]